MRNLSAHALGLLFMGLGLYGAAAVPPLAYPGAFDGLGYTTNTMALILMLVITAVFAMFAGWITARLVTDHRPGQALLMATIALAIAVFVGAVRWAAAPSWYYVASWCLLPAAAYVGALAWERSLRRKHDARSRRVATSA